MSEDLYDILGVDKTANKKEIRKAYHKLAKEHHPDKNGGERGIIDKLNAAKEVLLDDKKRDIYDRLGVASTEIDEKRDIKTALIKYINDALHDSSVSETRFKGILENAIIDDISKIKKELEGLTKKRDTVSLIKEKKYDGSPEREELKLVCDQVVRELSQLIYAQEYRLKIANKCLGMSNRYADDDDTEIYEGLANLLFNP